jgi:hypothetical protein
MSADKKTTHEQIATQDDLKRKLGLTRAELIAICERAFVSEDSWGNRDSKMAQAQLGKCCKCYALLKAGCAYRVNTTENSSTFIVTDENTIWITIISRGFTYFETGATYDDDRFYIPTIARLDRAAGRDWYSV